MISIVNKLRDNNETIACMESCTGGGIANAITNVVGASDVIKYSAVTYSNEYKIKMGIKKETIEKYTVYSAEVAEEMSYNIALYADATYGIGITGKINNEDIRNLKGEMNTAFISIYNRKRDKYYTYKVTVQGNNRETSKSYLINYLVKELKQII